MPKGQCHCGAVKYEMPSETIYQAVCHCRDCRLQTGAPIVAWALVQRDAMTITGETREYASSEQARRHFCPTCGTSLFYVNEGMFPGAIDVQIATLDNPDELPPQIQVQVADRIGWMAKLADLPEFERYPEGP